MGMYTSLSLDRKWKEVSSLFWTIACTFVDTANVFKSLFTIFILK